MGFSEHTKPPITVQAEQIEDEPRSVITPNGPVTAQPGDWEVRFPDGNVRAMSDEEFQSEFGESGSEDSGNRPSAPVTPGEDHDTDKDRESESASAVEDNTGSRKSAAVDSQAEDESTGDEAEQETETPETPAPPIRRRR